MCFIGTLPSYTWECIHQLRLFFQGPTYLITNDLSSPLALKIQKEFGVHLIAQQSVINESFQELLRRKGHKIAINEGLKDRSKLFIYSFERFYCLQELMKLFRLSNVFFMEIDNLVQNDPNVWLSSFSKKEMAYMYDHEDRCSSGICYIQKYEFLEKFLRHCNAQIENDTEFLSEMKALFRFYKKETDSVLMLPIQTPKKEYPRETWQTFSEFQSIFDAASIGIFIGGLDPFHTGGIIIKGSLGKWSCINQTNETFQWILDSENRKVPQMISDGTPIRINNLHIHSKNLRPQVSVVMNEFDLVDWITNQRKFVYVHAKNINSPKDCKTGSLFSPQSKDDLEKLIPVIQAIQETNLSKILVGPSFAAKVLFRVNDMYKPNETITQELRMFLVNDKSQILSITQKYPDSTIIDLQGLDFVFTLKNIPKTLSHVDVYSFRNRLLEPMKLKFDIQQQCQKHADVAKVYGNSKEKIWNHFLQHGLQEGRDFRCV